jgi:hypothetical protein
MIFGKSLERYLDQCSPEHETCDKRDCMDCRYSMYEDCDGNSVDTMMCRLSGTIDKPEWLECVEMATQNTDGIGISKCCKEFESAGDCDGI